MVGANIFFSEVEDQKIERFSRKWDLPKYLVVRKMIELFPEDERGSGKENV